MSKTFYNIIDGKRIVQFSAQYSEEVEHIASEVSQVCSLGANQVYTMLMVYIEKMIGANETKPPATMILHVDVEGGNNE